MNKTSDKNKASHRDLIKVMMMNPETNFFKRKAMDALIYRQGPS